MIVDALIVSSRNFKSIFVYQRFHVPPCAQETALFFATSFNQKVKYGIGLGCCQHELGQIA